MQAQPQIAARGQHRVHVRGKVHQQPGELGEGVRGGQLLQIVDDQDEAAAMICELRQHPVDHRPPVEGECRSRRLGAAGYAGGMADRAEQGQPEILGVVLVAVHLQDSVSMTLTGTVGPRTQQRSLPAASRSRDDRDLPRRRAVQGGEKISPVDQPGGCPSHRHTPYSERAAAELAVAGLTGVRNVRDEIDIAYDADPVDVDLHVQEALGRYALIPDDSDVQVDVKGSIITLTGHVGTWAEHDAAVGAAWMANGVIEVRDDLAITG